MRRKNNSHQQDIDDLKRQNSILENQIRTLERARATGNYAAESSEIVLENIKDSSSEEGDDEFDNNDSRRGNKRMKTNSSY
jgi:Max protein